MDSMTNIRIGGEKKVTPKCKVYDVIISNTKYKRFEFVQTDGRVSSQWIRKGNSLSDIEEESLEKIFNKFKSVNPA
jgi:hypothetical protein